LGPFAVYWTIGPMRAKHNFARRTITQFAVGTVALTLWAVPAAGQSPGDGVRIETDAAAIEGTLVDRLPDGYLVRVGDKTQVVPYSAVKSIAKVGGPAPAPEPSAEPVASSSPPPPTEPPPPPPPALVAQPGVVAAGATPPAGPPPPAATRPRSPGLVAGGTVMVAFGAIGLVAGVVLLPVGAAVKSTNQCHDPTGTKTFDCDYGPGSDMVTGGIVSLVAGGVLLLGGLPMIAVGARPQRVERARAAPTVAVGPRGGSVRWTF